MTYLYRINEGAKISQNFVNLALRDKNMTFGFEAEFHMSGVNELLKSFHIPGSIDIAEGQWKGKTISDSNFYDIIRYFDPISIGKSTIDKKLSNTRRFERLEKDELILQRMSLLYKNTFNNRPPIKYVKMFNELKKKYKSGHLLTLLQIFPKYDFQTDHETNRMIYSTIGKDNPVLSLTKLYMLNDMPYRMYETKFEEYHFNIDQYDFFDRQLIYDIIAERLEIYLGERVVAEANDTQSTHKSENYNVWVLTDDSSLWTGNNDFLGMELISPVKSPDEGLAYLQIILRMIQNPAKTLNLNSLKGQTTKEAGLHINIGYKNKDIDFVKLLFLIGDEYILKQFNRLNNDNSSSLYNEMIKNINNRTTNIYTIINKIEDTINWKFDDVNIVKKLFRNAIDKSKWFSVNLEKMQDGFIEFRSIGNTNYHNDFEKIRRVVLKMIVMIYVSTEDEVYKKEFLTKVYKLMKMIIQKFKKKEGLDIGYDKFNRKPGTKLPGEVVKHDSIL